jgi:hypothetical protein
LLRPKGSYFNLQCLVVSLKLGVLLLGFSALWQTPHFVDDSDCRTARGSSSGRVAIFDRSASSHFRCNSGRTRSSGRGTKQSECFQQLVGWNMTLPFNIAYLLVFVATTFYFYKFDNRPPKKTVVDSVVLANGFTAFLLYVIVDIALPALTGYTLTEYPDVATILTILIAVVDGF